MPLSRLLQVVEEALTFPIFTVKETPVTLSSLLMFVLVMAAFVVASRVIVRRLLIGVLSRTKIDEGLRYTFTRIMHYTMLVIGAVVGFQFIGIDLSGLLIVLGFLSVGIGFGLQNLTSNFISGLILLFERPIKVGDRITVGDTEGDVVEIKMRSTTVRSLNNIAIIVPNSDFVSSKVVNWSYGDPKVRLDVDVGVAYSSDLDTVIRSLHEVADENADILKMPKPEVLFMEFGDSSWNMRLRVWLDDPKKYLIVRSALNSGIVRKFRANGVEIPFPQRDLHIRSPLPVPHIVEDGKMPVGKKEQGS